MPQDAEPRLLTDFLRRLRAVREFRPGPVPDDVVQDILEVARWSGSASNRQAAEIVVVRDRELLKRLASLHGYLGHLAGAALGLILVLPGGSSKQAGADSDIARLSGPRTPAGSAKAALPDCS
jgi:nitroreductase